LLPCQKTLPLKSKANRKLQTNGLELIEEYCLPQQDLVADVVGYVDADRHGQAGVEYSHKKF